jgi:predicted HicB family RNase H-like nuclease
MTPQQRADLHVRMPRDLAALVHKKAREQNVSTNTYVVTLIAGAVGWKPTARRKR